MTLRLARLASIVFAHATLLAAGLLSVGCSDTDRVPTDFDPPVTTDVPNERQREIDRAQADGPLGFVDAANLRTVYFFSDISDGISGAPARYGNMLADKANPDVRREGMMGLVDRPWGQTRTFTAAYAEIASQPKQDALVRASAIRALNRSRARQFTALYVKNLADSEEIVRLEACKALGHMPDASAVAELLKMIAKPEETKDVRIAAIEAVRHYKRVDVARSLTSLLNDRDFGLAWSSLRSLQYLTGKDLGYDEAKWLGYLSAPDKDKPLG